MKCKNTLRLLFLAAFCSLLSQATAQYNVIGFYGTVNDYTGYLNNNNFGLFRYKYFKPGAEIGLQQYKNPFFNFMETISYDWVEYENATKAAGVDAQFLSFDFLFKYKFNNGYQLRTDAGVAPFLVLGAGGTFINAHPYINDKTADNPTYSNDGKLNLVAGAGITFRVTETMGIEYAAKVYMPLYNGWDGEKTAGNNIWANPIYVEHSLGLVFNLRKTYDSDHDGVTDSKDECPNTPRGVKVDSRGCPLDSDNDGIPDYLDRCPTVPGLAMYNGCPTGDSYNNNGGNNKNNSGDADGDGVPDSQDDCANTPINTKVDARGCPLGGGNNNPNGYPNNNSNGYPNGNNNDNDGLDTDGDGVPDKIDRCPNTPGPASNRGCPEIKSSSIKRLRFATRGIYFETAKAIIKPQSYAMLDEIVDIINQYPDYNIRITGHTDNVGTEEYNMALSQSRVDAVREYLIEKGISASKMDAIGYGKSKPIASNSSNIGRALNRRVELELYLK